ncbi:MAG TPA: DUF3006 domain-containing protein [Blastocatellia bacterium]|nr:DUF3006 domain-containing protein [Blastocatellia bacterium]
MSESNKQATKLSAVIDRIESGLAVIVLNDDDEVQFDIPMRYLPSGVSEGDHLSLSFELDDESKAAAKNRIAELKEKLNQSDPDEMNFKL